jgi:hypothetical protein
MPGRRPWKLEVLLVDGHARDSNADWLPRLCGRRGADEPSCVSVVQLLRGRQSLPCVDIRLHLPGETLTLLGHDGGVRGRCSLLEGVVVAVLGLSTVSG